MTPRSAGVLLYRRIAGVVEVLLVHPGGPYWRNKDAGAWQIPKGAVEPGEDDAAAARREVEEELGVILAGDLVPLAEIRQAGGKLVQGFAIEQDIDSEAIVSMTFELEWPPRSGRIRTFPEVDRARWFGMDEARAMMLASQQPLLDALDQMLAPPAAG